MGAKFACSREILHRGVQAAARAVSNRTFLPILGHLLITAELDRLRIAATDLEIAMECHIEANIEEQGALIVPARSLLDLLDRLSDGDVHVSNDEKEFKTNIRCHGSDFYFLGLPPEEFPRPIDIREEAGITVESAVLREAIAKSRFAVSRDESRFTITGILIRLDDDGVKFVSTDTHRLCVQDSPVVASKGAAQAIVAGRSMDEVMRILPDKPGTVDVAFGRGHIRFRSGDTMLTSRIIEGQFPTFEKVIPKEHDRTLTVLRDNFMFAIGRLRIIARENSNRIIMRAGHGNLVLSAESGNVGQASEEVEAVLDGSDIELAFNGVYMVEALHAIKEEAVTIEMTGSINPMVLRGQDSSDYISVLMPMQL